MINVEPVWWKVELFTLYQVVSGEMPIRVRLQSALNDPEPYVLLRNLATTPMVPGAPRLQGIGEGHLSKLSFSAVRSVEEEPPAPDLALELTRRFIYFQGTNVTIKASVEVPTGSDPMLHREMLFKQRFFRVVDATLTVIGSEAPPIQWSSCYLNRDQLVALYLG